MSTTPGTIQGTYGISTVASNITIESLSLTDSPQFETVPDQANAVANEILYDTRTDLKLTYRGTKLTVANGIVTFNSVKYFVDTHEDAGTYNGLQRFNLTAHRWANCPAST